MTSRPLCIGLDIGGTHARALGQRPGSPPVLVEGPGANPQRIGFDEAGRRVAALLQEIAERHDGAPVASVFAGVAGAGRPADQAAFAQAVRACLASPPIRLSVVHDAALTLQAALDDGPGLVVIAGTGSVVFARSTDGSTHRTGGWGYLLGDEGSGTSLGLAALRAVARAYDGLTSTSLQQTLAQRFGLDGQEAMIEAVYETDWQVQEAAPLVLKAAEAGDAVAADLVAQQVDALAAQAQQAARLARLDRPAVVLWGGMMQHAGYRSRLSESLRAVLPHCTFEAPRRQPLDYALQQAQRLAADAGG